jgi:hypothetical protein
MESEISKELSDMLSALEGTGGTEDLQENVEGDNSTDETNQSDSGDDDTASETTSEESPTDETSAANEPPTNEPPDEDKDSIIESLRKKINELESRKPEPEPTTPKTPVTEPLKIEPRDFIGDEDIDELISDKDKLNNLLNTVYSQGIENARKLISEHVLLSIPEIVRTNVSVMEDLRKTSEKFYDENKDLAPFKKVVASVFEELASKNPDKKYQDILDDVATESRKRLELVKAAQKSTPAPRLPQKKGTATKPAGKPQTSSLADEIAAMNEILGR